MHKKIIDNFLPELIFRELKNDITSNKFPFYIINRLNSFQTDKNKFDWYANHILYDDYTSMSNYFPKIESVIKRIKEVEIFRSLIRVKVNFYPYSEKLIEHAPHTDYDFSHTGAVLSLNTCDGFTRLSDNSIVDSGENRIVFFDASTIHNSTTTTTSIGRYNINFNFL